MSISTWFTMINALLLRKLHAIHSGLHSTAQFFDNHKYLVSANRSLSKLIPIKSEKFSGIGQSLRALTYRVSAALPENFPDLSSGVSRRGNFPGFHYVHFCFIVAFIIWISLCIT